MRGTALLKAALVVAGLGCVALAPGRCGAQPEPKRQALNLTADAFLVRIGVESRALKNVQTILEFVPDPKAQTMAWQVLPDGEPHELDVAATKEGFLFPAGTVGPGTYIVRVKAWDHKPASLLEPEQGKVDLPLQVLGPAVAVVIGVGAYASDSGYHSLRHAVDDARAMAGALGKLGYLPENILYLYGELGPDGKTAVLRTNLSGRGEVRSGEYVTDRAVADAVNLAGTRARQIGAWHGLVFYAGHGKTDNTGVPHSVYVCGNGRMVAIQTAASTLAGYLSPAPDGQPPMVTMLTDGCHVGSDGISDEPTRSTPFRGFFLFSCRPGETSKENLDGTPLAAYAVKGEDGEAFAGGFFTYSLLRALQEVQQGQVVTPAQILSAAHRMLDLLNQRAAAANEKAAAAGVASPPYPGRPQSLVDTSYVAPRCLAYPLFIRLDRPDVR